MDLFSQNLNINPAGNKTSHLVYALHGVSVIKLSSQGTDNMAAVFFAMHQLRLPIVVFWDLVHQGVNEVLLALQRSGLWPVVLELLLVFKLPYGPYAGQKFWRDLQSAARAMRSMELGASSHFAMWLGERIQVETGGRAPLADVWDRKGVRRRRP